MPIFDKTSENIVSLTGYFFKDWSSNSNFKYKTQDLVKSIPFNFFFCENICGHFKKHFFRAYSQKSHVPHMASVY